MRREHYAMIYLNNILVKHLHILGFLSIAILILWGMLAPGYILTLDMVWSDTMTQMWSTDSFNSNAPLYLLFSTLALLLPLWVVQKLLLVGIFFLLLYIPFRFLPFIQSVQGRWFCALFYTFNPFVYARFLAGQWNVLLGYACLPFVFYSLHSLIKKRSYLSGIQYGLALSIVGIVSIHFLYLSLIFSMIWIGSHLVKYIYSDRTQLNKSLATSILIGMTVFIVTSAYWIVPALTRATPLETRFDEAHFIGFAASENHLTTTPLNLAVLGGFWAEGDEWRYHFLWPQDQRLFWLSAIGILGLIFLGLPTLLQNPHHRFTAIILLIIGGLSYITALGAWGGTFTSFNLWLYEHIPGWSGLRDSHKIAGILALVYAVFAGIGVDRLIAVSKENARFVNLLLPIVFVLPIIFGMYQLFGFRAQITPTEYPISWYHVREVIHNASKEEKMLVLPWQGYFSLPFNNQNLVANPAPRFFGIDKVVSGRSVGVESIYDQEIDPTYKEIDTFLHNADTLSEETIRNFLQSHNIRYLFLVINDDVLDQNAWLLPPRDISASETPTELMIKNPEESSLVRALLQVPHDKIAYPEVILYRFSY